jgi:hypothetical protein
MRRLVAGTLMLALAVSAVGCSSVQFNVPEPKAARWTWKTNFVFWESWGSPKKSTCLPATLTLQSHSRYIAKITDIPLHQGTVVYAQMKVFGESPFTKAGQVPIVITGQDLQDVERGNVVRIVVVDPKKQFQTARFVQIRLSPTEDALKRGEEIGKPLALVTLGNREPKFHDWGTFGKKASSY